MWIQAAVLSWLFLLTAVLQPSQQIFSMNRKSDLVDIVYPPQAHSERGLAVCKSNAVCSVLYRRFWFRMRIERVCRCPHRSECPMEWSSKRDNYTMTLNNRSQLKFCQAVSELPQCSAKSYAITVMTQTATPSLSKETIHTSILAACNCPPNHYWKFHQHSGNKFENGTTYKRTTYKCMKLHKCNVKEFCGNMRADYYFTYYQCSCPHGLLCLQKNHETYNVSEFLYTGSAYRAICSPN
ncbi:uncharacterized protein LOC110838670 [Zootermopsis nevadensis]|uniref:Protein giant-lens n=1 Tax=Zootermopsis nevadensis TaxID=136037 RepID=A0A067QXL8_ZOONE|nr:uncharacterized protein LOC110838670 [Zootermopsis nevadensis]KDR09491.1 hypothetical protein L798_00831 [Zootermopsis nevadensis]